MIIGKFLERFVLHLISCFKVLRVFSNWWNEKTISYHCRGSNVTLLIIPSISLSVPAENIFFRLILLKWITQISWWKNWYRIILMSKKKKLFPVFPKQNNFTDFFFHRCVSITLLFILAKYWLFCEFRNLKPYWIILLSILKKSFSDMKWWKQWSRCIFRKRYVPLEILRRIGSRIYFLQSYYSLV